MDKYKYSYLDDKGIYCYQSSDISLNMKKLSVFVDESGDTGFENGTSNYYVVSLVFHEGLASDLGCNTLINKQ